LNAIEIINQVRAHDAEVVLEASRLVVRGTGEPLPPELQAALRNHRAEVMVALGAPANMAVNAVLAEIRPYLPPALSRLSDENLVVLVNWSVIHAWNQSVARVSNRQPIRSLR